MAPLLCGDLGHLWPSDRPYQQQRLGAEGRCPPGACRLQGCPHLLPLNPALAPDLGQHSPCRGTLGCKQSRGSPSKRCASGRQREHRPTAFPLHRLPSLEFRAPPEARLPGVGSWGRQSPPGKHSIPWPGDSSRSQWPSLTNRPWVFRTHALVLYIFLTYFTGGPCVPYLLICGESGYNLNNTGYLGTTKITTCLGARGESPQRAASGGRSSSTAPWPGHGDSPENPGWVPPTGLAPGGLFCSIRPLHNGMRWHPPRVASPGENTVPWNSSWWLAEGRDDPKGLQCEAWRRAVSRPHLHGSCGLQGIHPCLRFLRCADTARLSPGLRLLQVP